MPRFGPGSGLRSPLDKDDLTNQHKKTNVTNQSTFGLAIAVEKMERQLAQLRRRILTPPPPQSPSTESLHPFKIYRPSNAGTIGKGLIFKDQSGIPTVCTIDAGSPTDLTATPPTVNPTTDYWRFFAVRDGLLEYRNYYGVLPSDVAQMNNYASVIDISFGGGGYGFLSGADGVSPYNPDDRRQYDDPTLNIYNNPDFIDQFGSVIIYDGSPTGTTFFYFWIQITPTISGSSTVPAINIAASTLGYPASSPFIIQIGKVEFSSDYSYLDAVIYQSLFGSIVNRWQPGMFFPGQPTDPKSTIPGALSYRGNISVDDLSNQFFYPGDILSVDSTFVVSGTTIKSRDLYMSLAVCSTTNPSIDPNFLKIAGANL